jgi:hypothetical protein
VATGILLHQGTTPVPAHTTADSAVLGAVAGAPNASPSGPAASRSAVTAVKPTTTAPATQPPAAAAQPNTTAAPPAPPPPADKQLAFDFQYQPNFYYCAPAATHMALSARGANLSQDDLANRLRTTVNGTASAEETTRVLNDVLGTTFYRTTAIPGPSATPAQMDQLQTDVVHAISNGYAVVANAMGSTTDAAGVGHDFPAGHYVTIVGYSDDGRTVRVADSSGMFGPSTYWISTINMANWMAGHGYSA